MIRGLLATELRWDFDKINKTSWPDITDLLNYWHKSPPMGQLMNLYLKAKGLVIKAASEPTAFEKQVESNMPKHNLSQVPPHLRGLLQEVQEGKHKRGGQRG